MYLEKIKTFFKKLNYKSFVLIFLLIYGIMPIVQRSVSTYLTTYSYMALVVVVVLFTFVTCQLKNTRGFLLFLLPFVIYQVIILLYYHNQDVLLSGYQTLLFVMPACIGYYLVTRPFFSALYTTMIVIGFIITGVTTTIGCIQYPEAARVLATILTSDDPVAVMYDWMNIGGYHFVYMTVLLYPFVVIAFKMKKLHFIPTILLTVLTYTMVITAEYTYAFILLMTSTMLFFLPKGITVKRFFILILMLVLIVLLFRSTIGAIITAVGEQVGESSIIDKLKVLFLGKSSVAGFSDKRDELYMISIKSFFRDPLFGNLFQRKNGTSGHSFILDNLANFGLIGGGLMVLMYRGIYLVFFKPLKDQMGYCYMIWAFVQPIFLSLINTNMWLDVYCLYMPIVICAIYGHDPYLHKKVEKPTPLVKVNVLQSKVKTNETDVDMQRGV